MTYMIVDPDDLTRDEEVIFDTTNRTIQLVKVDKLGDEGVTLQAVYSFCKDMWKEEDDLIKLPFPFIAITEEKFELVNGWDFKDATTKNLIRIGGWALKDAEGVSQEEYAGIITLGVIDSSDQAYYVQDPATNAIPVNIVLTGPVNQAVKVYGDLTHENFDYRGFFKIFCREYAKTYALSQLDDIGVTVMTYQVYRFPLSNAADLKIVDDDVTVDEEEPYTNMSIEWFTVGQERTGLVGGSGYFHVIIDGAEGTAEQIYTFVQRQLRKDTDIDAGAGGDKTGKITAGLLNFVGDTLYTLLYTTGEGTFIDNYQTVDETRLYFRDDDNALRNFPYAAVLTLNFGANLKVDSDAKFWVFFTTSIDPVGYDYGTVNAIMVQDKNEEDMTGNCTGLDSKQLSYAFDINQQRGNTTNPADEEIPITVVAIGLSSAQFVIATGLLKRSLANVVSLVAALERNYLE